MTLTSVISLRFPLNRFFGFFVNLTIPVSVA